MSSRPPRRRTMLGRAFAALALIAGLIVGPAIVTVAQATSVTTVPPTTPDPESIGDNPFIPEDANIGDCISSAPRPECGSDERGGYHQYVTLIVLFLGTLFIGWRITLAVRAHDREVNDPVDKADTTSV